MVVMEIFRALAMQYCSIGKAHYVFCAFIFHRKNKKEEGGVESWEEMIRGKSLSVSSQLYLFDDKLEHLRNSYLNFNACELNCFIIISVLMYESHLQKR